MPEVVTPSPKEAFVGFFQDLWKQLTKKAEDGPLTAELSEKEKQTLLDLVLNTGFASGGLVRYTGVKTGQAKVLAKALASIKGTYREPFLGTGTLFRQLFSSGKLKGKASLAETNSNLRELFATVSSHPREVATRVDELLAAHSNLATKEARERLTHEMLTRIPELSGVEKAAHQIAAGSRVRKYLPGTPAKSYVLDSANYTTAKGINKRILDLSLGLKKTKAKIHSDWTEALRGTKAEDFLMIDPPYVGSANRYAKGFRGNEALAQSVRKLADKGASGLVWNSPEGANLYPWLEMKPTRWLGGKEVAGGFGPLGEGLEGLLR